jgi:hypothetical protein
MALRYSAAGDFGFQVPLANGRGWVGGGAVADIFINPYLIGNEMGGVLRVNGAYWHLKSANQSRDFAQKQTLENLGYKVFDIFDTDVAQPGALDAFMTTIFGAQTKL